jgi:hypothetical protein
MTENDEPTKHHEELRKDGEERLQRFRELARRVGEKIEELGLIEEELDARIEAVRKEYHSKKCGD